MALDKTTAAALKSALADLKAQEKAQEQAINAWFNTAKKGLKGADLTNLQNQKKYLLQDAKNWLQQATTAANEAAYGVTGIPTGVNALEPVPTTLTSPGSMLTLQSSAPPLTADQLQSAYTIPYPTTIAQPGVPAGFQQVSTQAGVLLMPVVPPGGQYPAAPYGYSYTQTAYGPAIVPSASLAAPINLGGQTYTTPVTSTAQPYYAPTPSYQPMPYYAPSYQPTPSQPSYAPALGQSYTPYTYQPTDTFTMPYAPVPADVYAPSSATMVMTSPGGPGQTSPAITSAMVSQANSQYQSDDYGNLWPSPFGSYEAQVLMPPTRPVRRVRRRQTVIQRINSSPVLLGAFGQAAGITGLLGSIIGAASNIGGAAITAVLAPHPAAAKAAAPVVAAAQSAIAPAPAPKPSGFSFSNPWVIGGTVVAGVLVLAIVLKKRA